MKRKSLLAIVMTGVLFCGLYSTNVMADNTINKGDTTTTKQTNLSYSVSADYEVVIPEQVELNGSNPSLTFSADKINTETGYEVQVKIDGLNTDGKAALARTTEKTYTILVPVLLGGETIKNNDAVARFKDKNTTPITGTGTLTFGTPQAADGEEMIKAGSYTGILNFQVSYTNVTPPSEK